jgi:REP element-mobilizing transposase RayT
MAILFWRRFVGTLGSMPRRPRTEGEGAFHYAIARGNGGDRIVTDDRDRTASLDRLEYVAERFAWRVHAYCVVDNHLHLVVQTLEPTLGVGMQRLVGGHASRSIVAIGEQDISLPGLTTRPRSKQRLT